MKKYCEHYFNKSSNICPFCKRNAKEIIKFKKKEKQQNLEKYLNK